ncbi:NAD(P)H-dependent oxidoreductase [Cytophaga sp. FL35]|uniref:NAD(P)H-dependent oxidoreductase n=1 Tax=Cytophaga sp. FL35 TaxID=1904456 RepID=UPI0016537084|nr:NAD(P)H-dependent oxidoreductase [Cytophaga sp. FL35]MBC6997021.1 NAD(P)H-dependent oxidoreductase [Cytophaga sp. FL35]
MKNVLAINAHQFYPFSEGKLNQSLTEKAIKQLADAGFEVKTTITNNGDGFSVEEEIEKLKWANIVFLQMPLNWMGVPWSFKKYMDEVFSVGMMGSLSQGDGRTKEAPKKNYGLGGLLKGKYMISVTANAPKESFNNTNEKFFNGLSEDELLAPMHLNFKWFGLEPLETFFAYDVMKNPEIENDFIRFEKHIKEELVDKV